jgi:hypothetical protein
MNRRELLAQFEAKSTPGRLQKAKLRLARFESHPDFADLPDCKQARLALKIAEELCDLKQWERADAQLAAFDAATNAATARLVIESERNRRIAGGRKSGGARRAKGDAVRAAFAAHLAKGVSEQEAKVKVLADHGLTKRQLTDYLKRR